MVKEMTRRLVFVSRLRDDVFLCFLSLQHVGFSSRYHLEGALSKGRGLTQRDKSKLVCQAEKPFKSV